MFIAVIYRVIVGKINLTKKNLSDLKGGKFNDKKEI